MIENPTISPALPSYARGTHGLTKYPDGLFSPGKKKITYAFFFFLNRERELKFIFIWNYNMYLKTESSIMWQFNVIKLG